MVATNWILALPWGNLKRAINAKNFSQKEKIPKTSPESEDWGKMSLLQGTGSYFKQLG